MFLLQKAIAHLKKQKFISGLSIYLGIFRSTQLYCHLLVWLNDMELHVFATKAKTY